VRCTVREPLSKVSRTIEDVLGKLTVWDLTEKAEQQESSGELVTLR
jgi:DNA-binding IscR family transcriptional regulator